MSTQPRPPAWPLRPNLLLSPSAPDPRPPPPRALAASATAAVTSKHSTTPRFSFAEHSR